MYTCVSLFFCLIIKTEVENKTQEVKNKQMQVQKVEEECVKVEQILRETRVRRIIA